MADLPTIRLERTDRYSMTMTREQVIGLLNGDGLELPCPEIPKDAKVFIKVPSGGDYSGDLLHLDGFTQLEVTWEVKS